MLKALSKYVPRHTLNGIYKLYIRPHLDYGAVIYHIPNAFDDTSQNVILNSQMKKLESSYLVIYFCLYVFFQLSMCNGHRVVM